MNTNKIKGYIGLDRNYTFVYRLFLKKIKFQNVKNATKSKPNTE